MSNYKTLSPLRISPTPFKSSLLSIPPSPFLPRTPLTPTLAFRHQAQREHQPSPKSNFQPAAYASTSPLAWLWTCHQCHRSYRLGVTRRCLDDGHYYCSGTSTIKAWRKPKSSRRVKKHRACASEFDYSAWKEWGRWRRGGPGNKATRSTGCSVGGQARDIEQGNKDCWNTCDYPSECKWGKKFGIHTPIETVFPPTETNTLPTLTAPINTTSEGILKPENCKRIKSSKNPERATFWAALVASVERKKSGSGRSLSPLCTATETTDAGQNVNTALPARNSDGRLVSGIFMPKADDNQITLSDSEASQEGFEPLSRAQSRGHRGYLSCSV